MKRSDLLYVMSLGRGGVPDASALRNRSALRRALANREHSSACAGASGDECGCSCGGSLHGGGSGDADPLAGTRVSALNRSPDGRTYVGFTDVSAEPPRHHYLPVGGEEDGWNVVSADYDSEEVVLEKDGKRIAVKLGGGPAERGSEAGEQVPEAGGESGSPQGQPAEEPPEFDGEGVDLGDAWEDFHESGIWSMGDNNREGILEDIRERYEQEGDSALENGERKFLEQYEKWESVQSMAGMIVEGGGGEPPPFAETQARLNGKLDDPAATDEDKAEAHLVYRAEMEAARRIWEAKAGQAFFTQYGRSADTEAEAREGERLAGVPYEYLGSLADGYLENRNRCGRRRRKLANRAAGEARRRLANVGWTDEARAAALAARRAKASATGEVGGARGIFAPPGRGTPVDPAKHGYRMPPGYRPPATEGTVVTAGGAVSLMVDGKLMRIGSAKVLSVGPDGNLLLKTRSGTIDLGKVWGASADPVADIDAAILDVIKAAKYGSLMGVGVLFGASAWVLFKNQDKVRGRFVIGNGGKGGNLAVPTEDNAGQLFVGTPQVRTSYMVFDNAAPGVAEEVKFLLDTTVLVFARRPNPTRRDPSFMKSFRLMGKYMVPSSYMRDDGRVEVAKFDWSEDVRVTNSAAVKRLNVSAT